MRTYSKPLTIATLTVLFAAVAVFRVPYGQWDAWAIWNAMARMLYYNRASDVFQYSYTLHRDYPPLWYLSVLHGFYLFGDTRLVPIALSGAVYMAVLWLMRRTGQGLLIVGLVALPYATMQGVDLPLSLALLGAVVAYHHNKSLWIGFALGVGLLLKNEGALIALCFFGVWVLNTRRIPFKALAVFLPFAACLLMFKSVVNVPNDVVQSTGILARAIDLSRYAVMFPLLIQGLFSFGSGVLVVTTGLIAIEGRVIRWTLPMTVCALVILGYVGIYAITPYDIAVHIATSWDRLILHVFPVMIYEVYRS